MTDPNRPAPEVGTFAQADLGDEPGILRRVGIRRGPPTGWRVATVASSFLLLSAVAGMMSLLAGLFLLMPLAVLALPFLARLRSRRGPAPQSGGPRRHSSMFQSWGGRRSIA